MTNNFEKFSALWFRETDRFKMTNSSDSESSNDSDKGIRYKTDSTRNKAQIKSPSVREESHHGRRRNSSPDEEYKRRKRRKEKESRRIRNETHEDKTEENEDNLDTNFGPALPPHLLKQNCNALPSGKIIEDKPLANTLGPMLPPHLVKNSASTTNSEDESETDSVRHVIGPALPPYLLNSTHDDHTEGKRSTDESITELNVFNSLETIGPALPPHLLKSIHKNYTQDKDDEDSQVPREISPKTIGPALPPHLRKISKGESDEEQTPSGTVIGPTLPPHLRKQLTESSPCAALPENEDDDCYGPLPEGAPLTKTHLQLEERSLQLRINQLNPEGNDEPKREEWMLELPAVRAANLGLGPRKFRMKGTPDMSDRSSWTDTPQDKAKKQEDNVELEIDIKKEAERISLKKRDKQQEEMVKKSKRSSESLVDMHKKKMKEKKKDEPASNERRPFSRDVDLQVNRFDEAQKKAVLKKAQLLDDRFSSGQSKFL